MRNEEKGLKGFYWKVYIITIVLVFFTVIGITFIFRSIQRDTFFIHLEREFKTEAFLLAQLFSKFQKPYILEEWRLEGKPRITILSKNGEVQLDTHFNPFKMKNEGAQPEIIAALNNGWGKSIRWSQYVQLKMFFVAEYFHYSDQPDMIIRLSIPLYEINRSINRTTSTVLLGGIVIFLIVSLFSLIMIRGVTDPIMKIAASIREFSNGNISIRLPHFRNRELNLLSTELNRMIESITKGRGELSMVKDRTGKILASMHEGIILVNRKGIIKQANIATRDIFGLRPGRLEGKNLFSIIESSELKKGVESILMGNERVSGAVSVNVPEQRRIEFTCTPFGDGTGVVIALHDITKLAKLEQIRKEFVANVSHELKTPITSLKMAAETLGTIKQLDNTDESKRFLNIIQRNILRMENIIADLLTLSRIESGDYTLPESPVFINECIESAIDQLDVKYPGRIIQLRGNEYRMYVQGDRNLIELALVNLIDNALTYSGDDVEVVLDGNYRKVLVSVIDHGAGIEPYKINKIFERFYRIDKARSRALGGTGLGLTIVKNIAEIHKGTVKVHSVVNQGSTFRIEFPRYVE